MAYYTIRKRLRREQTVYCASVIEKIGGRIIFSKSKTHSTKVNATKWAKELIKRVEIRNDDNLDEISLEMLIKKYMEFKSSSNRPLGRTGTFAYKGILNYSIAKLVVSRIQSKDIVEFCLERKKSEHSPGPSTIAIDVSLLRKLLRVGKSLFGVNCNQNCITESYQALHDLKLIGKSAQRERRLEGNEYDLLIGLFEKKQKHHCCKIPYSDIFLFSLDTCLRISEVTALRWEDFDAERQVIVVRNRKSPHGSTGNHSLIPLLGNALIIILKQPRHNKHIFPFNSRSITSGFRHACKKLKIKDLHYHDLRREGATRLMEKGYTIEEVATVTGHRDIKVLWQVYTRITPEHLLNKEVSMLKNNAQQKPK